MSISFAMDVDQIEDDAGHIGSELLMSMALLLVSSLIVFDVLIPQRDLIQDISTQGSSNLDDVSYYEQSLKTINPQINSERQRSSEELSDELWNDFNNFQHQKISEKKNIYQTKSFEERQKTKDLQVYGFEVKEENGKQIVYYNLMIKKGRNASLVNQTKRRYSEFRNFFGDLKKVYPNTNFPNFPGKAFGINKADIALCQQRQTDLNLFLKFVVEQDLDCDCTSKFISARSEVKYYGAKSKKQEMQMYKKRTFSGEFVVLPAAVKQEEILEMSSPKKNEQEFSVSSYQAAGDIRVHILNTFVQEDQNDKFAIYQIQVTTPQKEIIVNHRFDDFKQLRRKLRTKFEKIPKLPQKSTLFSSKTDPKLIEYRRSKLDQFLKQLLGETKLINEQDLLKFLNIIPEDENSQTHDSKDRVSSF